MLTEDLDAFFDADEHATECVVIETQQVVSGIFERPYSDALDVQGFTPSLTMKSCDASEFLRRGYRIEIGDDVFRVALIEPDGTGVSRVVLEIE